MELIEKRALLDAYDAEHQGPPGGARKLIEQAPTVDAVPIKPLCAWLAGYAAPPKYAIDAVNGKILEADDRARAWEYHWQHLMECGLMEEEPNGRDHGPVDQG